MRGKGGKREEGRGKRMDAVASHPSPRPRVRSLFLPPTHLDLFLDEIDSCDHFSYGMLHLDARIHLHEVESLGLPQKLDRSDAAVPDRLGRVHRRVAHRLAHVGREHRGGRLLQQLLVPALNAAIPLPEVNAVAVLVAQDLKLDVPGVLDVPFNVHGSIAEGGLGLPLRLFHQRHVLVDASRQTHATPAPARGSFDHEGEADLFGDLHRLLVALDEAVRPGNRGHARRGHRVARRGLVPHERDGFALRTDEREAVVLADVHEGRVLAQEAVTGMHGIRAVRDGGRDDVRHVQVRLLARGRADAHGLVGDLHVQGVLVRGRVHGDGLDAHLAARADDAHGNLAAVRDEHLVDRAAALAVAAPARAAVGGRDDPRGRRRRALVEASSKRTGR